MEDAKHRNDDEDLGPAYRQLREQLMKRLAGTDAAILINVVHEHQPDAAERLVSDWPDSFNRNSWYKTWGDAIQMEPQEREQQ
ncbi:hypothetical protein [Mycolicibacterium helvum]|uniref:Uncharacterized protein n=1 Tax=Mycolicibacterium helvum TaxID=1534349 RepID=A0A7I7TCV1_9MYCO|nr:hypothetical protein [Mycolicibacterium helvum]BBY66860.1 hypothetical protein MHEL_51030 [Mycolicibacterium helvum]